MVGGCYTHGQPKKQWCGGALGQRRSKNVHVIMCYIHGGGGGTFMIIWLGNGEVVARHGGTTGASLPMTPGVCGGWCGFGVVAKQECARMGAGRTVGAGQAVRGGGTFSHVSTTQAVSSNDHTAALPFPLPSTTSLNYS